MLSATQFNEAADALFEHIVETIDATDAADDIELNQGVLEITWREDGHVLMTGPVATSFIGTLDLADFSP